MIAVFIDGPLAGETMMVNPGMVSPEFRVMKPRVTRCFCSEDFADEFEHNEPFTYHRIAVGSSVAFYSGEIEGEKALANSLKAWMVSDLSQSTLMNNCRSRRAWS